MLGMKKNYCCGAPLLMRLLLCCFILFSYTYALSFGGVSTRSFSFSPKVDDRPKLILISGCTGTGKSTFGMSVALDQNILKCISTDTVRAVMRSFIPEDISPALHRSSYTPSVADGSDDPVRSWRETCTVLSKSVEGLVDDAIKRGVSLVVEGVHVVPSNELIEKWQESGGGVAMGCLLVISDQDAHKSLLQKRGIMTGKGDAEQKKLLAFDRVRAIQDEMMTLAQESNWLVIEQKLEPDPLEMVSRTLWDGAEQIKSSGVANFSATEEASTNKEELSELLSSIEETTEVDCEPLLGSKDDDELLLG